MITFGTKARLQGLCSTFQSDYQQSDVKKLYSTYIQIPQAIVVARRRRHKSAEETNIAVQKTERFSRYMTWLAKRVEYYEKAFEVRFWRLLDHDFIANTTYSVAAFVFVGIFWAAFGDFVNANLPIATPVGTFPLNQVGVAAAVTLYVLSFFVLSSIPSFNVGSKEQLEEWLKIKNWTRYSKFDLHNAVADLVGDQVKEIHHAEDQIRG
jgi:glutathione S-transferase